MILWGVCLPEVTPSRTTTDTHQGRAVQIGGCAGAGTLYIKTFATISNVVYEVCWALLREAVRAVLFFLDACFFQHHNARHALN